MTCPYCGSVRYVYRSVIGNKILDDTVEVERRYICEECEQDFIEHSEYVATSFKTIKMEDWE